MHVKRIISGGQTGADQGGLEAAFVLGIATGGTTPRHFTTEYGAAPQLEVLGLKANDSVDYAVRTEQNVIDSDGTVIFGDVNSPGSRKTLTYCKLRSKPVFIIDGLEPGALYAWLVEHKIEVLNVAGNRESRNRGIQKSTREFLLMALYGAHRFVMLRTMSAEYSIKYDGLREEKNFTVLGPAGRVADTNTLVQALSFIPR